MIPAPIVTVDELNEFLLDAFPTPRGYRVHTFTDRGARFVMPIGHEHSRPGGTVSGPTMMGFADGAAWLATLSRIGIVPLAVTSTLTIHFLEKPPLVDLVADAELLRLGARSSVTEVRITGGDDGPLVAVASVGYAIPA